MKTAIVKIIRKGVKYFGYDFISVNQRADNTLLGVKRFPIRTIIDIGSNTGQFAKKMIQFFPTAQIYCFEPIPEVFKKLVSWSMKETQIKCFNYALGDKNELIKMYQHVDFSPSSSILKTTLRNETLFPQMRNQQIITIEQKTLDTFFFDNSTSLMPDTLIKLDVQGYEDRVIKGGTKTFKSCKACVIEVNLDNLYNNQASFNDLVNMLHDLGYHYGGNLEQHFADDGHVIFIDAVFINKRDL